MPRLSVPKTYKMLINGAYVRSERGYVSSQTDGTGKVIATYPLASRKDVREAVAAARKAQNGWAKRSAFNRSQILFRIAEMLETRRKGFEESLAQWLNFSEEEAVVELDAAIDRVFWYAGWADKYAQVFSSVNPVAAPFFNFTTPEPTGVVALFAPASSPLSGLVSVLMPVILSGNTAVLVADSVSPLSALDFAEVIGVSDVPNGVVNILTGQREELITPMANHMDINALAGFGLSAEEEKRITELAAANMKRIHFGKDNGKTDWQQVDNQSLYAVLPFVEFKTAWHPIGV
ncbi:MAG: aldehyde dehydrogenase family protein [Bacteroidetes Order II. Incertae sedis bacterium]|nr:aldehyde dehydrogenase family protein [Bacteroidetes Order II. bacterium]